MSLITSVPQFHLCDEGDKAAGKPLSATTQRTTGQCVCQRPHDCQRAARTLFRSPLPSAPHSCPSNHVEFSGCLTATLRNIKLGSTGKGGSMRALAESKGPGNLILFGFPVLIFQRDHLGSYNHITTTMYQIPARS